MKDKLEKTGKTKKYYRKHLMIKISLVALTFITACAVPIGVSYRVAEVANAKANETASLIEEVENLSSQEETTNLSEN